MIRNILLSLFFFILLIAGCSTKGTGNQVVAMVENREITQEDIDFGLLRANLIEEMKREKMSGREKSVTNSDQPTDKSVLTELVKLHSLELLADEKKITVSEDEVNNRINKVKIALSGSKVFQKTVSDYGEERFWEREKDWYRQIILVEKMMEIFIKEEKQKNPQADERLLKFNARKSIEDLAVEQVQKLDIKME